MFWNGIPGEDILRIWKKFRDHLTDLDLKSQVEEISKFFSTTPYGSRTIDYYDSASWPTPWEILHYGSYCRSSISLLIFYTITLVNRNVKADLYLIDDEEDIYLIPVIEDQYILNYYPGSVNNYSEILEKVKVLRIFSQKNIKIIT